MITVHGIFYRTFSCSSIANPITFAGTIAYVSEKCPGLCTTPIANSAVVYQHGIAYHHMDIVFLHIYL